MVQSIDRLICSILDPADAGMIEAHCARTGSTPSRVVRMVIHLIALRRQTTAEERVERREEHLPISRHANGQWFTTRRIDGKKRFFYFGKERPEAMRRYREWQRQYGPRVTPLPPKPGPDHPWRQPQNTNQ